MKNSRQSVILEIIAKQDIETQNQLIEALQEQGVKSTQATISRDIKDLRLIKELSPRGIYRYVAPSTDITSNQADRLSVIFRESVTSFVAAQNLIVLKTIEGLAPAACSAIDKMKVNNLVGTLAGDDTALLVMTDAEAATHFCDEIHQLIRK